jgi:Amt family ammonium transporter
MPKSSMSHWFCQYVYAVTASTIVSGAVAERCNFVAYIIFSGVMSALIYPIVAHWVWSESGWLAVGISVGTLKSNFQDFAGSGVVHMVGGTAAFVGALLLGPRIGRFDPGSRNPIAIQGHSVPVRILLLICR